MIIVEIIIIILSILIKILSFCFVNGYSTVLITKIFAILITHPRFVETLKEISIYSIKTFIKYFIKYFFFTLFLFIKYFLIIVIKTLVRSFNFCCFFFKHFNGFIYFICQNYFINGNSENEQNNRNKENLLNRLQFQGKY